MLRPFEDIVDEHGPVVMRVCRALLGSHDADDAWSDTFLSAMQAYPDLRTQPIMLSWPPPRTGPCWCGSGRKYKLCCRPHGLGGLD